jgi:pyruvate/2-oxoglutarate dehydrogenase complex dihydrolipoamide dehydrogenase (E3) component
MGTRVTIIQRNKRLLPQEEPELGRLLLEDAQAHGDLHRDRGGAGEGR